MQKYDLHRALCVGFLLIPILAAGGCAANTTTADNGQQAVERSPADPWEPTNRRIHAVNMEVDSVTLKPIAQRYERWVPQFLRTGVRNFSRNLNGPLYIINNFLQGKGRNGFSETGRFVINSTVGVLGLVDVASGIGMEFHPEDFGQTLAVWGVPNGPYVIVPFYGPQTLRDAMALPLDFLADPLFYFQNKEVAYSLLAIRIVSLRAGFLSAEALLEDSFDPYVRLREAYLQNRRYAVYDGDPPDDDDFYDDIYDDLPEPEPDLPD